MQSREIKVDPDSGLFERLRALRKRLADERKVPAFVVFSDRSLEDMAVLRPRSRDTIPIVVVATLMP